MRSVLISALFTAPAVPSSGPAAVLTLHVFVWNGGFSARLRLEWWPIFVPGFGPILGFGPPVLPMALDFPANFSPLLSITRAAAHAVQYSLCLSVVMCEPVCCRVLSRGVVSSVAPLAASRCASGQRWYPIPHFYAGLIDVPEALVPAVDAYRTFFFSTDILFTSVLSHLSSPTESPCSSFQLFMSVDGSIQEPAA